MTKALNLQTVEESNTNIGKNNYEKSKITVFILFESGEPPCLLRVPTPLYVF